MEASLPTAAKSLSIASVPRASSKQKQAAGRVRLNRALVARLSASLMGLTREPCCQAVLNASSLPEKPSTLLRVSSQHHASLARETPHLKAGASGKGRRSASSTSLVGDRIEGEGGEAERREGEEARCWMYLKKTRYTTTKATLLPGSLSTGASPRCFPFTPPTTASVDTSSRLANPAATRLTAGADTWQQLEGSRPSCITQQVPGELPSWLRPADLAVKSRRLKCPPSSSTASSSLVATGSPLLAHPLHHQKEASSIAQLRRRRAHCEKSCATQGFRKTPVMRRRRKLAAAVALSKTPATCDRNNISNYYYLRPTCASSSSSSSSSLGMRPCIIPAALSILLMLLLTNPQATATSNDTSAAAAAPLLLEPLPSDTTSNTAGGPFSKLLEFARIFVMVAIIVGDICGNSLVILSVCRHSKLRVTTNWFVVSLACADILVALFAMTFSASVIISGRWVFGRWVCDFWNSCDVLASTASILHLCCISIDRYIAITRPLDYPMKITTRRVIYALCAVWISSALLSYLPIFTGVYTTAEHIEWLKANPDQCEFTVNRLYAIVSSSVSFWIPSSIMVFTYYRIYREASRQEKFIYKAQSMLPAPMPHSNHHHHHHHHHNNSSTNNRPRSKRHRSKSVAVGALANSRASNQAAPKQVGGGDLGPNLATTSLLTTTTTSPQSTEAGSIPAISGPPTGSSLDQLETISGGGGGGGSQQVNPTAAAAANVQLQQLAEEQDSNSGQSTPTKRSISKMKREHKAAKTLGIIMGVFILCWLPFFSWYTPMHICGSACHRIVPQEVVPILFWIGYFNSTLNPIIYAYFNHDFRDAFKKTLQWLFCCCNDLKCGRSSRPNDNQHYNCTYRSTQEIGLVSNS